MRRLAGTFARLAPSGDNGYSLPLLLGLLSLAITLLPACGTLEEDVVPPTEVAPTAAVTMPPPVTLVYSTFDGLWLVDLDDRPVQIHAEPQAIPSSDGSRLLSYDAIQQDGLLIDRTDGTILNLTRTADRIECCFQWWPGRPELVLFGSAEANVTQDPREVRYYPAIVGVDGEGYRILDDEHPINGSGAPGTLAPAPDGRTIVYGAGNFGWFYRHGGEGIEIFNPVVYGLNVDEPYAIAQPAWSPDGTRLAWIVKGSELPNGVAEDGGSDWTGVVVFDLAARTAQILHRYESSDVGWPPAPVWSPDGRRLAFVDSSSAERAGLWVAQVGAESEMVHLGPGGNPVWSPDGRWLAFRPRVQEAGPFVLGALVEAGVWEFRPLDFPVDGHVQLVAWIEPGVTITGAVMDASLSARIILLEEPVEGYSTIALTEESKLVSADGSEITLRDIQPGVAIQASGQPGESNALIASQVLVLDATPIQTKAPELIPRQAVAEMTTVVYEGISFTFDHAIAADMVAETVPATDEHEPPQTVKPAHVLFSLNDYILPDTFHRPRVLVYPFAEFEAVSEYAGRTIADLRQLLVDRPAAPEQIPFLPLFHAGQMMRAQIAYIDFQNGKGVRFLTQYAQAYLPINNHELFYTFQGQTNDGQYYVAAILPVSHPTLPADQTAYAGGDLDMLVQHFDTYIADIERQLNAQDGSSFTPDLSLLDAMIQSLEVEPSPTLSPSLSRPTATARTGEPTPVQQEPGEEKQVMLTAEPTPTPSFPDLPDLAPPADGWIAFETPEEQLALISPDGSRHVPVIKEGEVRSFAWSPDGRSLAFVRDGQLTILSIEDARFTPLTPPRAIRSTELTWSQDSRHLAYLHSLEKGSRLVAPDALRVLDIAAREAITVSSYANTRPDERAILCPQPFPFPLLAVKEAGFSRIVLMWDVRDREVLTELHPPSFGCDYLWLPDMPGVIFAREEAEKPGIEWTCIEDTQDCIKGETKVSYPTSVTVWRMGENSAGDEAPTVVLEGTQKRHYYPTRWLPDGRLEVQVRQFEKTTYENRAQPQHVTYRYLVPTEDGTLREAESGDLPWWAAGGFGERFEATDLYREQNRERPVIPGWEVGPDGETVAFACSRQVDAEEWESAIYLWRGEGEPRHLTAGSYPQWQWGILPRAYSKISAW